MFLLALVALIAACGKPQEDTPFSEEAQAAAATINSDQLRQWVATLSDDAMEGRGPGSAGDAKARKYIAEQLEAMGYQPGAADDSWEQPFDLVGITADVPDSWIFTSADDVREYARWDQFIAGSGVQKARSEIVGAEIVFVGYGMQAPEYDWDDFKDADLDGKILLIMNNDPDWDPELFAGETRLWYGRWDYKYETAARRGAVGAIIIHTTPSAGYPFQVIQTSGTGEQFELPAGDEPRLEVTAWMTEDTVRDLVSMTGHDLDALRESAKSRDFQPVPLGITTSFSLRNSLNWTQSANVLGVLPGSDPDLAAEAVIYTAHHDHLGIGTPNDQGDAIYNGARDNAGGVSVVLGIAKAMAALPTAPRRSLLMAFVGAEEQGLLGSEYFARNPTVPAGRIAANINFDSPNIWGETSDITYIGKGKSTLDGVAQQVADYQGRIVKPDQFPSRGMFYRSDQFNMARIGIPALYLKEGTEFVGQPEGWGIEQINAYTSVNYHQPSDELTDDWNFDGMVMDARFGFWAGLIIANADEMQSWNPGDEFEAARLEALEALNSGE